MSAVNVYCLIDREGGNDDMKTEKLLMLSLAILAFLMFNTVGMCAPSDDQAPLPAKLRIVPPGPDVNPELAKLSGKWVGRMSVVHVTWTADVNHVLVVESIANGRVTVIYSRAGYQMRRNYSAGWWGRYKGFWDEEKKVLLVNYAVGEKYATLTYRLDADGVLHGSGTSGRETRTMRLQKESD